LDAGSSADATAKLAAKKAMQLKSQDADPSLPNPKSAFESGPETAADKAAGDPSEQTRPRVTKEGDPSDPASQAKPAGAGADSAAKNDQGSPQLNKNTRRKPTSKSDVSDSDSNSNKKKKGGFLKIFKKIFG
jgi:hypothetical protein